MPVVIIEPKAVLSYYQRLSDGARVVISFDYRRFLGDSREKAKPDPDVVCEHKRPEQNFFVISLLGGGIRAGDGENNRPTLACHIAMRFRCIWDSRNILRGVTGVAIKMHLEVR